MGANGVVTSIDIIEECFVEDLHVGVEAVWEQKATSAQLSQSKAAAVPRRVGLGLAEQVAQLLDDLISEVFGKSLRDSAKTFGSRPPNNVVVVLQRLKQQLDDCLQLLKVDVILIKHLFILFFLGGLLDLIGLHEMRERPRASLVPPRCHLGLEEDTAHSLCQLDLVLPDRKKDTSDKHLINFPDN